MHLLQGLLLIFSLAGSNLSQPQIQVFPPAQEEITTGSATLVCAVRGFFPGNITMEWRIDGKSPEQGVNAGLVARAKGQIYSATSYLTVSVSGWNSGEIYTCMVTHKSLVSPLKKAISSKTS